jgi:hypothetical protein
MAQMTMNELIMATFLLTVAPPSALYFLYNFRLGCKKKIQKILGLVQKKKKSLIFFKILNIEVSIRTQGGYPCPRNWNVLSVMPISRLKEPKGQGILSSVPTARSPSK